MLIDGRPDVPQFDLDVLGCPSNMSSHPTQYEGTTADGRPVYIRYRNGWLSIHVGEAGAPDVSGSDDDLAYRVRIGPPFHGRIALEQISDLTGVRFDGRRLTLSEEAYRARQEREGLVDFSGRRAHWTRSLHPTAAGMQSVYESLRARFGRVAVLDLAAWYRSLHAGQAPLPFLPARPRDLPLHSGLICIGGDEARLAAAFTGGHVPTTRIQDLFDLVVEYHCSEIVDPRKLWKVPLDAAGLDVAAWPHSTGYLATTFLCDRPESRAAFESLREIANRSFVNRYERVDLLTGAVLETRQGGKWFGNDLVAWCAAAPNRFTQAGKYGDDYIGFRPVAP